MTDLLGRSIGIGVAKPGERELVAVVRHERRQVVEFAESVGNESTSASSLALLEFFGLSCAATRCSASVDLLLALVQSLRLGYAACHVVQVSRATIRAGSQVDAI